MYTPLGHQKIQNVAMDLDKKLYIEIMKETLDEYEKLIRKNKGMNV